jgi:hypothetical protein
MKILNLIILFIVIIQNSNAQVKKTAYRSSSYVEKVWSKTKEDYVMVETVFKPSQFVFTEDRIFFKKGGSKSWLYNDWKFDNSEEISGGQTIDTYFDERGQKIVIFYENSEVWYFHGADPNTNKYGNLTIYKNCREDKNLIAEAEKTMNTDASGDKFRLDFNSVSIYDPKTEKWSDWQDGLNTFVINANSNGDIVHITANGKEKLYRRTSKEVERDTTKDGKGYQIINAIDDDGDSFRFQLFDDVSVGIKMIYGNMMIQFAK